MPKHLYTDCPQAKLGPAISCPDCTTTLAVLGDLEACEPNELPWQKGIHIRYAGHSTTSSGCAHIDLLAEDRDELVTFFLAHWGGDDDWTSEAIARIETVPAESLRGEYVVTETPDDPSLNPLWVGRADSPLDALDRFAEAEGFPPYSTVAVEHADEGGWLFNYETDSTVCLGAVFTNTQVFALPVD